MPAMATVDHDWLAMALSVASETSTGKSDLKGLRWQVLEVSRGRFGCAAEPTAGDPIPVLDEVLIAMQQFMNSITIPSPEDAKAWLKSRGGDASARSLGRLSSLRNAKAHSLGMRIVADASRLAEQVQTDDGWQQWHDDDGIDEEGLQQLNRESQVVPVKSLMRKHPVASTDDEPEDEDSAGSDRGAAPGSSGFVAQQNNAMMMYGDVKVTSKNETEPALQWRQWNRKWQWQCRTCESCWIWHDKCKCPICGGSCDEAELRASKPPD